MPCGCQSSNQRVESRVINMANMVNYEGKMVSFDTLPSGCLFINGVWYSNPDALPAGLKPKYGKLFSRAPQKVVEANAKKVEKPISPSPVKVEPVAKQDVAEEKSGKKRSAVVPIMAGIEESGIEDTGALASENIDGDIDEEILE